MIDAAALRRALPDKLEAMTAVCSVGLDMIAIPGDTPAEVISAIIADEAAIGMVNTKTTAVRLIPAIGKNGRRRAQFRRPAWAAAPSWKSTAIRPPNLSIAAVGFPRQCRA